MLGLAAPTWAVPMVIVSDATFVMENTVPLLSPPGSWSFRSDPFPTDPDHPDPNPETFEILDFAFSFAGHSFDETDAIFCFCEFTAQGDVLRVSLFFDAGTVFLRRARARTGARTRHTRTARPGPSRSQLDETQSELSL